MWECQHLAVRKHNTLYSETSDSGPPEKGTLYSTQNKAYDYNLNLREEDNLSTRDKACEFILSPCVLCLEVSLY